MHQDNNVHRQYIVKSSRRVEASKISSLGKGQLLATSVGKHFLEHVRLDCEIVRASGCL